VRRWLAPPRTLRPTRAGWSFFVLTFGVGFGALNTGNNLLYLVLSLMLAFLVLSGLLSESALRGIRVERDLPREMFAGAPSRIVLRIHNDQPRVPAFAIVVEDHGYLGADAHDPHGADKDHESSEPTGRAFALRIGAGEHELRAYSFTPRRRGRSAFAGQRVSTRFPFGLFVKSRWLDDPCAAIVFPAIESVGALASVAAPRPTGDSQSGPDGQGADVSGLREFVTGDSARRIHWKSSLRRGELVVGEVDAADDAEIEVLLRTRGPSPDQFEQRVVWAASEVVGHLERGLRVSLRTDTDRIEPGTGPVHRAHLLRFLALVALDREPDAQPSPLDPAREHG
jgi:uncharacterized protein (DUF58 family)